MVKKIAIFGLIVLTLFLFSCAAPETTTEKPTSVSTTVKDDSGITITQSDEPAPEPTPAPTPTKTMTQEVKDLLAAHSRIKSYEFIKNLGDPVPQQFYGKGDKYVKFVPRPSKYNDPSENYDRVFIDRAAKTASAYCGDVDEVKCPKEFRNEAYSLSFTDEDVVLPLDLLKGVTGAEKIGSKVIDSRKTVLIQFINADNQKERLYIGSFYGFVFQRDIVGDDDEVIESDTFTSASFDAIKDSDVNLPEGVKIY
ncbi:MAG: hypothetical protein KAT77_00975 [Nanoarchaeota archaeon]|nr:hypothetical protein [Nanoarchaeota archaeon]